MFKVSFEAEGLIQRLTGIVKSITDLSLAMSKIGDLLVESNRRNILEGGRPTPFKPTKAGNTPLLARGRLLAGIMKSSFSEDHVEVEAGSGGLDRRVPAVHQFGATIQQVITERQRKFFWARWYAEGDPMWKAMALSKNMTIDIPARRYFRIQDEDVERIRTLLADHILRAT